MIRQEAARLVQSVPRRSSQRVQEDTERRVQSSTQFHFAFAEDTVSGPPTNCEEFLARDSSLNVLEMMGPLPDANDKTDSDAVLISRMTPMYDQVVQQQQQQPIVEPPPV
jgi:hypothetical protein